MLKSLYSTNRRPVLGFFSGTDDESALNASMLSSGNFLEEIRTNSSSLSKPEYISSRMVLLGPENSGKSSIGMDLAKHLVDSRAASGSRFLDESTNEINNQGKQHDHPKIVLYLKHSSCFHHGSKARDNNYDDDSSDCTSSSSDAEEEMLLFPPPCHFVGREKSNRYSLNNNNGDDVIDKDAEDHMRYRKQLEELDNQHENRNKNQNESNTDIINDGTSMNYLENVEMKYIASRDELIWYLSSLHCHAKKRQICGIILEDVDQFIIDLPEQDKEDKIQHEKCNATTTPGSVPFDVMTPQPPQGITTQQQEKIKSSTQTSSTPQRKRGRVTKKTPQEAKAASCITEQMARLAQILAILTDTIDFLEDMEYQYQQRKNTLEQNCDHHQNDISVLVTINTSSMSFLQSIETYHSLEQQPYQYHSPRSNQTPTTYHQNRLYQTMLLNYMSSVWSIEPILKTTDDSNTNTTKHIISSVANSPPPSSLSWWQLSLDLIRHVNFYGEIQIMDNTTSNNSQQHQLHKKQKDINDTITKSTQLTHNQATSFALANYYIRPTSTTPQNRTGNFLNSSKNNACHPCSDCDYDNSQQQQEYCLFGSSHASLDWYLVK